MSFEIIAIGNEVLSGMIVNGNAAKIADAMTAQGWSVARHTVVPDDPDILEKSLRDALARSSIVITTGGLGPTCDDITRSIAAKIFHSPLERNAEIAKELEQRFGKTLQSLEDQAIAPTKAKRLANSVGTASGWLFSEEGRHLALLPGPPREMFRMLQEELMPHLKKIMGESSYTTRTLHLSCLREDDVDPTLRRLAKDYPDVFMGIYPGYGTVSVRFSGAQKESIQRCVEEIEREFKTYLFDSPNGKIEESLQAWFKEHGLTLALAESCTGGKMATQITSLPGASSYFLGSFVVYSDSLKKQVLGVSQKTLEAHGAVSQETVKEMLAGVFKVTEADWAIAVSGIAGPAGGSHDKPEGTVWAGIAARGQPPELIKMYLPFGREIFIAVTANRLLGSLLRKARFSIPFTGFEQ